MYAIIESGGKQYRVKQGDILNVELLNAEAGTVVQAERFWLLARAKLLQVGNPTVAGASVSLKVLEHGKGKKVVVFHYKPKKHSKKKNGHRQPFTKVQVEAINA